MPRRRSHVIRNLLLIAVMAVFLLMGVSPLIELLLPVNSSAARWLEWSRSRVMESMVALWFFAFGSMVGSFINVVVWRMPRGVSVVSKGSACPWCTNKIQLKDNIPIFGWIKLGGRCRVCRLPISPRYPIVEAIFGFVFLLMFFVELQSACGNLPGGSRYLSTGILQVVIGTKWDVILTYVFHMVLLVMLLTWSLMVYDGSRIPVKTIVFSLILGFGISVCFPYVHPVQWSPDDGWFADLPAIQRSATPFLGLACGFFTGSLLEIIFARREVEATRQPGCGLTIGFVTVGLFTGWQATIWISLLLSVGMVIRYYLKATRFVPACGVLTSTTLLFLLSWRWFQETPDEAIAFVPLAIALSLSLVMAWMVSRMPRTFDQSSLSPGDQ